MGIKYLRKYPHCSVLGWC